MFDFLNLVVKKSIIDTILPVKKKKGDVVIK